MKIGIIGNRAKKETAETINAFIGFIRSSGYEIVEFPTHTEIDGVDVVLVLGGDGAILHAAVVAAQKNIKIIGINYGTLGFLAEYEKGEAQCVKELLMGLEDDNCRIVKRSLLQVEVAGRKYYALNEIAIQRDCGLNMENARQILSLEVNAHEGVTAVTGDGILICTPTGSTAYSLSAGGAIITPEVPVFMMTPICAFSMRARPIVFSDTEEFTISNLEGKAVVLADGRSVANLPKGATIKIKKAPFTADFPVKDTSVFLSKVKNKLNG